jgi:hypothetical protein
MTLPVEISQILSVPSTPPVYNTDSSEEHEILLTKEVWPYSLRTLFIRLPYLSLILESIILRVLSDRATKTRLPD